MHDVCKRDGYRIAFTHAPVPMVSCDGATFRLIDANACARRLFGARCAGQDGAGILSLYAAEHRARVRAALERTLRDGAALLEDVQPERHDGQPAHGHTRCLRIDGAGGGTAILLIGQGPSDDAQRGLHEQLLRTRADLSHAQEIAHLGIWAVDMRTGIVETTSPEICRIFHLSEDGKPIRVEDLFQHIHPDDLPRVLGTLDRALHVPGARYDCEYRVMGVGYIRHVHSLADAAPGADGTPTRIVGVVRDVTDIRRAQQEVRHLAFFDEITGLPNRVAVRRQLAATFDADERALPVAVLAIDLAHFRQINLTLGHLNGDQLLRDVAQRIARLLGDDVYLARTANAQFTALLPETHTHAAQQEAEAIVRAFESTFLIAGVRYEIGVHVGIAVAPRHAGDPAGLLRNADVAAFQARQDGLSTMVYAPVADPYDPQRLALLGEFRHALGAGQIELYCQPKVAMASGAVIGAEALVRWRHPARGLVPPSEFIPLIESTELIHALTAHVLREAVRQSYAWRQEGMAVPIAVNLSTRNLNAGNIAHQLQTLLADWGGSPDWIGLEITESSLIADPGTSIAQLNALSQLGFQLFIDDFGTGYSSLNYLTMLPVDVIKIDHGFTTTMLTDKRAAAIVKATIDLAHDLGMAVVAEGTASREIWDALAGYGCDEAQGFYVAPPLPAGEFADWVRNRAFRMP
ncbi:EAL domain-containing protein [Massilia pinisoli]|uniref:EAL domain-containing protein n=1 Tax=Massilia pinisoli TaxID=1772194 RepID=A0ABT1ZMQ4_9BURK|nr:GGDEF and EAL domain-containing protein [Massilia pinisoli]MCS0581188.1 EAL domain-containing protein [Massilia pinisoli]